MLFSLAQMDIGPMVPDICGFAGVVIFGSLLAAVLWWRNGSHKTVAVSLVFIVSVFCIVWIGFAIHVAFYEPRIGEEEAMSLVENLPEVQPYLSKKLDQAHFENPLLSYPDNVPGMPDYTVEFLYGPKPDPVLLLRVNLINSKITAFDKTHGWLPIDEWRKVQAASNVHLPNKS